MIFERMQLDEELSPYVESIFYFKDLNPEHSVERVVPTGHIFLLMELDDIPRHTYASEDLKMRGTFTKSWVSGVHSDFLSISAPQNSSMMVVQFRPTGAYPFFKQDLSEFSNQVQDAASLVGEEIITLRARILSETDVKGKFQLTSTYLKSKIDSSITIPKEIEALYAKFEDEPFEKHKSLVSDSNTSRKHLIDQFKKFHGNTPQVAHRVLRFNGILSEIRNKTNIKWSDICYQCGFSDQSHFIKEFQNFCGINPKKFIVNNFHEGQPNFFPVK